MLNKKIQNHCNTIKDLEYLEKDINKVIINRISIFNEKRRKNFILWEWWVSC